MTTFDEIRALAKLPEKSVEVCFRGDLQAEYEGLERELRRAKAASLGTLAGTSEDAKAIEELMAGLREQMRESSRTFTLRALPKKRWSDLHAQHKPRDEDRANRLDYNGDTFPVAAVAACLIDPVLTVKEVEELVDEVLTQGQWDDLFLAVFLVNKANVEIPT